MRYTHDSRVLRGVGQLARRRRATTRRGCRATTARPKVPGKDTHPMASTKQDDKTTWHPVNTNTLPPEIAKLYKAVRDAADAQAKTYKAMKAAEDACSKALIPLLGAPPSGKLHKVAFRYGLAIATVDADSVKPQGAKTLNLADYLAANAA